MIVIKNSHWGETKKGKAKENENRKRRKKEEK